MHKSHNKLGKIFLGLPVYIWTLLFIVIPIVMMLKSSFSPDYAQPLVTKTKDHVLKITLFLEHYYQLFTDPFYKNVLWASFKISGITTLFSSICGFAIAYAIFKSKPKWQPILLLLVVLPLCISFLLRVYAWMTLLSTNGIINQFLLRTGLINTPIPFLGNVYTVIIGTIYCYLPFMVLPIYTQLSKVEKSLLEASSDLGALPYQTFWYVTLPLVLPGILTGCIMIFIPVMGEFIIPELLGSAEIVTLGRAIQWEFFNQHNWVMTSCIALITILFLVAPTVLFQTLHHKKYEQDR